MLKFTGLIDPLKDGGHYTVFAPTDQAFAAMSEGAVEKLMANTRRARETNFPELLRA